MRIYTGPGYTFLWHCFGIKTGGIARKSFVKDSLMSLKIRNSFKISFGLNAMNSVLVGVVAVVC